MSRSKEERRGVKRKLRRIRPPSKRRNEISAHADVSLVSPDIQREIRDITQLAQAGDSRIVTFGNLILFSTRTRDAWLLDPDDELAVCLCRDGEPQPVRILDTPESFAIEWTTNFAIEGPAFIIRERSGRAVVIHGYPTVEIADACQG
jgi:hypothetical protein